MTATIGASVLSSDEREELRRLRREVNRQLRQERDIHCQRPRPGLLRTT